MKTSSRSCESTLVEIDGTDTVCGMFAVPQNSRKLRTWYLTASYRPATPSRMLRSVAVLDSRLSTKKSYRWDLIKAMPDFARTSDPAEVIARLESLRDQ